MRNNAITRIIIYSILIVLLLGILLTGLGIGLFMVDLDFSSSEYTTIQGGTVQFDPQQVSNIQIEWASGNIDFITADVDSICFFEEGNNITQEGAMSHRQSGDTVYIRFQNTSSILGLFNTHSKDLTVTVPRAWNCQSLDISIASADIRITELSAQRVHIETASGDCRFDSCSIGQLEIDGASSSVHYQGSLNTLECDTASGSFTGILENTPISIEMDTASGDLDITLPENTGYQVELDALSGRFTSEFGNSLYYGDGSCKIDFDGVSGDIQIRKGK